MPQKIQHTKKPPATQSHIFRIRELSSSLRGQTHHTNCSPVPVSPAPRGTQGSARVEQQQGVGARTCAWRKRHGCTPMESKRERAREREAARAREKREQAATSLLVPRAYGDSIMLRTRRRSTRVSARRARVRTRAGAAQHHIDAYGTEDDHVPLDFFSFGALVFVPWGVLRGGGIRTPLHTPACTLPHSTRLNRGLNTTRSLEGTGAGGRHARLQCATHDAACAQPSSTGRLRGYRGADRTYRARCT